MAFTAKSLGIDRLDLNERLALAEEIRATICADARRFPVSRSQGIELDRRVADDDEFPDDVVAWDEVRASIRIRLGR